MQGTTARNPGRPRRKQGEIDAAQLLADADRHALRPGDVHRAWVVRGA